MELEEPLMKEVMKEYNSVLPRWKTGIQIRLPAIYLMELFEQGLDVWAENSLCVLHCICIRLTML